MIRDKHFPWLISDKQKSVNKKDDNGWLIIYLDVFTLMLSMFVIILGYKMHSQQSYEELTQTVYETATKQHVVKPKKEQNKQVIANKKDDFSLTEKEQFKSRQRKQDQIKLQFQKLLQRHNLLGSVDLRVTETAIKLEIENKILFKLGIAALSENGEDILVQLLPILNSRQGDIFIEGHTDSLPIATKQFPSNWELSTQRATSVLRFLIEEGIPPKRLRAIGFADTQPVADNESEQGRARNRRVSIAIQSEME